MRRFFNLSDIYFPWQVCSITVRLSRVFVRCYLILLDVLFAKQVTPNQRSLGCVGYVNKPNHEQNVIFSV